MTANEIQIDFVERLSILVCKLCKSVVSGNQLSRHLGQSRHRLMKHNTSALRTALMTRLSTCHGLDLGDLRTPTEPVLAIPGLPIFRDGLACKYTGSDCRFIVRDLSSLHAHLRKAHGWINKQTLGRRRTAEERKLVPWRTDVICQQFVPRGRSSQLFEVFIQEEDNGDTHLEQFDSPSLADNCWDPDVEAKLKAFEIRRRDAIPATSASTPNSFVERMAWPQYLEGFSRTDVLHLARRVDSGNEPVLHFVHERMSSIVNTCSLSTITRRIGDSIRDDFRI